MSETPLLRLRKQAGVTGYAVARDAGVSTNYYYKLERDGHNMSVEMAVKLARVLATVLKRTPSSVLAELTGVDQKKNAATREVAAA